MPSKILSVVVPVHNISDHVDHLAGELGKLAGLDPQVVIVDDGSTDGTVAALRAVMSPVGDFTVIESVENAGAGVARNIGFSRAEGLYTLFFDGDDYLHVDGLIATIETLERTGADASINSYEFIRDGQTTGTGMNVVDRVLWRDYYNAFNGGAFPLSKAPRFLEFTNYPWNKVVRTAHFRSLDLDPLFGETMVNNDILGHWNTLLHARRIVLIDRIIVTHHISDARDHLSNRFGAERLELFVALRSVLDVLKRDPDAERLYSPVFWSFVRRLVLWAEAKVQAEVAPEFAAQSRALVSDVSFEALLALKTSAEAGTYRWLMDHIA